MNLNLTRTIHLSLLLSLVLVIGFPGIGAAQVAVSGSNTAKLEYYRSFGDQSASPYAYQHGQFYDELDLDLSQRLSPFENWRIQTSGLYNDSKYRSTETDLILERFKLNWEKGDGSVPFRFTGGDVYGYFSYRTLQRSFKGGQVEFQPDWFGVENSLMIVSGAQGSSWGYMDISQEVTSGASWLVSSPGFGNISANWVKTDVEADATAGQAGQTQDVFSLTGEKDLNWLGQKLNLEAETAYFSRGSCRYQRHGQRTGPCGYRAFSSSSEAKAKSPLTYRVRYENYGKDFPSGRCRNHRRPRGRRDASGLAVSRAGMSLTGRGQFYTDAQESANPVDTATLGLNLSASLGRWVRGLSGNMDMYHQAVESQDLTTDQRTDNINLSLGPSPGTGMERPNFGLLYRNTDDRVAGDTSGSTTREVQGQRQPRFSNR